MAYCYRFLANLQPCSGSKNPVPNWLALIPLVVWQDFFYFVLQIAHILSYLIEEGKLLKEWFPKPYGSVKVLFYKILEGFRNYASLDKIAEFINFEELGLLDTT